jgi:hypothetical protein
VSNTEAVLALVRKHLRRRGLHLGIGAGASHHLVRGMARAARERRAHLSCERIESKVLRQLSCALAPALTDVRVSWGGLEVRQAPHRVPAVFAGGRVLVYGFLGQPLSREVEVKLEARSAERALSFPVPLSPAKKRSGSLVARRARALLRDLEDRGEGRGTVGLRNTAFEMTSFAIEKRADSPRRSCSAAFPALLAGGGGRLRGRRECWRLHAAASGCQRLIRRTSLSVALALGRACRPAAGGWP